MPVPSDESIAHRALLFASLCNGKSRIRAWAGGDDNTSTREALASMGVMFDESGSGAERQIVVTGVGLFGLKKPQRDLDCGNSGTTMRLPHRHTRRARVRRQALVGDASLSARRPMMRIAGPLNARGAKITGKAHPTKPNEITAPLHVNKLAEGAYLGAIEYELPVASAQVKSALLLSGLYAHGTTTLREPMLSRDHTERMLAALGVPLKTLSTMVELDPAGWSGTMPPFDMAIPGDISAATFLLGAALIVPGSNITTRNVGINPTRTGILDALRMMSAPLSIEPIGDANGEPVGNLTMTHGAVTGASVASEVVTRAIDEIPALCAIASCAHGTTTIRDAIRASREGYYSHRRHNRNAPCVRRRVRAARRRRHRRVGKRRRTSETCHHRLARRSPHRNVRGDPRFACERPEQNHERRLHRDELSPIRRHAPRARRGDRSHIRRLGV